MTAGLILGKLGIKYEIIEASDRYGGRIKKSDDLADGIPVDLGAEWIHTFVGGRPDVLKGIMDGTDEEFERYAYTPTDVVCINNQKQIERMNIIAVTAMSMVGDYKFKNSSWFDVIETKIAPFVKDNIHLNLPVTSIN